MPVLPCEPVSARTVASTPVEHVAREPAERHDRVGHDHGGGLGGPAAEHRVGAGGVVVAVGALAHERHEQSSGHRGAGVDVRRPVDDEVGVAVHGAAGDRRDVGQRHRDHERLRGRGRPAAPRGPPRGRRRGGRRRRSPGRSRGPCRRPAPRRRPGPTHGLVDGLAALADLDAPRRQPPGPGEASAAPASIAARIVGGVLGAGVVVGDHEDVGEPGGDLAHDRPLALVAVAAGAEHDDHPAGGDRPQRGDGGLDGVGLVGVVDDDLEGVLGHETTSTRPGTAVSPRPWARRPAVEAGLAAGGQRRERVGDVERARQRGPGRDPGAVGREHGEGRAADAGAQVDRAPVGLVAGRGEGGDRDRGLGGEPAAVLVVDVDQGPAGPLGGEQRRLGGVVALDVAVEVEVVATEVEEHRDVEDHAVDPAQAQRVARDLHRARLDLALAHQRQQSVQVRAPRAW